MVTTSDAAARRWLGRIHRCAADMLDEARAADTPVTLQPPGAGVDGIWCVFSGERRIQVYVAVPPGAAETAVLPTLAARLEALLTQRDGRAVDCTLHGQNTQLIAYVRAQGFSPRGAGTEFHYPASRPLPPVDLGPLQIRPFASTPVMPYLELLDLAFNPLKKPSDWDTTNAYRRDIAGSSRLLLERNRQDEFAGFWKGERLVGLYLLEHNLLATIAIHPDFQRKGFGSRLLHHAQHRILRERGFEEMFLYVTAENEGALRFYRRHQFDAAAEYSEHAYVGVT